MDYGILPIIGIGTENLKNLQFFIFAQRRCNLENLYFLSLKYCYKVLKRYSRRLQKVIKLENGGKADILEDSRIKVFGGQLWLVIGGNDGFMNKIIKYDSTLRFFSFIN